MRKENIVTWKFQHRLGCALLAALVSSPAIVRADPGFTISTSRESAITIGMSASEVERLLGRPARAVRYRNAPGPTWTYNVVGAIFGKTEFNIDFGPDQTVISMGEQVIIRSASG